MFLQGQLVKSKNRADNYPLFLMILDDEDFSETQFKAVVIKCITDDADFSELSGYIANNWNKDFFEVVDWSELKKWL